jgi:hypothetical protein
VAEGGPGNLRHLRLLATLEAGARDRGGFPADQDQRSNEVKRPEAHQATFKHLTGKIPGLRLL